MHWVWLSRRLAQGQRLAATREEALRRQRPATVAPRVGVDAQVRLVELVDVQAARLAAAVRPRLP